MCPDARRIEYLLPSTGIGVIFLANVPDGIVLTLVPNTPLMICA